MSLAELFVIAVGLSMDAFAVSVCKGLAMPKMNWKGALLVGLYFGGFQAAMPLFGYFLGSSFSLAIRAYDHWVAFILLSVIGANMVKESFSKEDECPDADLDIKNMVSVAGVKAGSAFGCRYKSRAELAGGAILILMGFKILLEHLGILFR